VPAAGVAVGVGVHVIRDDSGIRVG
jgi:hypothetical protein